MAGVELIVELEPFTILADFHVQLLDTCVEPLDLEENLPLLLLSRRDDGVPVVLLTFMGLAGLGAGG